MKGHINLRRLQPLHPVSGYEAGWVIVTRHTTSWHLFTNVKTLLGWLWWGRKKICLSVCIIHKGYMQQCLSYLGNNPYLLNSVRSILEPIFSFSLKQTKSYKCLIKVASYYTAWVIMCDTQQWLMPNHYCQSVHIIVFPKFISENTNISTTSNLIHLERWSKFN